MGRFHLAGVFVCDQIDRLEDALDKIATIITQPATARESLYDRNGIACRGLQSRNGVRWSGCRSHFILPAVGALALVGGHRVAFCETEKCVMSDGVVFKYSKLTILATF